MKKKFNAENAKKKKNTKGNWKGNDLCHLMHFVIFVLPCIITMIEN
jgi:hypothetical protein